MSSNSGESILKLGDNNMGSMTEVKGKTVSINMPSHMLYSVFSDMRNFLQNLPEDKKEGITVTEDSIEGEVKGIRMGAQVSERRPFSFIQFKDYGKTPFSFEVELYLEATGIQTTDFHMELRADLPFMIKMMIGNRLQEVINTMTDQLALAAEGKLSPADFNMGAFSPTDDLSNRN